MTEDFLNIRISIMPDKDYTRIIQQCEDQKKAIRGFIYDLKILSKTAYMVKDKLKYKMQIVKYRKRSSALSTHILIFEHK